ncbi:uncharacterized protein LOC120759614 [Hirundo rustica]|uniref:uncharacterized protein LOC120759614 n=1 Tax=Hirundo rustica TaxID=43150 RepID=UPI001A93D8AC|nr:uncharacterized protein LOC120759614 [Hirundo rustica]XP_039934989.1 uncharacterized protein LOC120759614 [Hirundo rustica]XP_039934990.1 uncharacterized protein LOC120759614 [Hirundo rustica]
MESQCYPGGCQVVPIWKLVTMWPSEKEEEETVILISDDDDGEVQCPDDGGDEVQCPDDDDDDDESTQGSSVVFVEPQEKSPLEEPRSEEMVDEEGDLVVTYCKQANVMPHARHDCTTHPFERTESDICSPLGKNADICDQCYCYICDKLAAECQLWTVPSLCHCNAHNKSNFWKAQRSFALAGVLATFNLELLELDAELRHGGDLLEKFIKDLSVAYNKYLGGERMCPPGHECCCEPKLPPGQCDVCSSQKMEVVYKYSDVFELVTRFLNQAEQESPKAAAIMLLGAAKQIALHKDPAMLRNYQNVGHTDSLRIAVPFLFQRITVRLQRMLVLCDFPKILNQKFIEFFQSISLPCHCYAFSNSLNVLPWDHVLLTTVLKGQNITGQRRQKGRKMYLWEAFPVVEARVEKLLGKKKYKEVVRYLRAVKCNENQRLRDLRDLIPFYLCKTGHFLDAAHSLLFPVNSLACCSACRITPCQFSVYLKIFRTGCVPSGNDVLETGSWVTAGSPLRISVLIKQALKLLYNSEVLYRNAKCWSSFIMILASSCSLEKRGNVVPLSLEEPPLDFQENVLTATGNFLEDLKSGVNVSLPSSIFSGQLHQEASLILAVQAVQQMLCYDLPHLASFLEIILAFGKNFWALRLLLDQLSCAEHILCGTANLLLRDLSQEKATVLTVWQNLGPQYVGEFLCLFLTCRHKRMQSVGLFSLRLVIDNLHLCPWVKQLCTFFQESGLRRLPFGTTVYHEVSKFVSAFEKL